MKTLIIGSAMMVMCAVSGMGADRPYASGRGATAQVPEEPFQGEKMTNIIEIQKRLIAALEKELALQVKKNADLETKIKELAEEYEKYKTEHP